MSNHVKQQDDSCLTSDKHQCNILVSMLVRHGVREVVVSPGSRNAPIVVALTAEPNLACTVIVDERSAAFVALGKSLASGVPVALVCTSGTAVLNYAPAVAEAYYRQVPLIVLSADRPMEWIDQDDSQTLRQFEALGHFVKRSYDIPSECSSPSMLWFANRVANDAMITALTGPRGPVHINVQLDNPLGRMCSSQTSRWTERTVALCQPASCLSDSDAHNLSRRLASAKGVLVVAGFHAPDAELLEALRMFARRDNVAVMCETLANLPVPEFIHDIDATLSALTDDALREMAPDIVITLGGAIVSRMIKRFLRESPDATEHWQIGLSGTTVVDCFQRLTRRIALPAADFFRSIEAAGAIESVCQSDYGKRWMEVSCRSAEAHAAFLANAPWTTLVATRYVMSEMPGGWQLHLSNGTSVRYAQLFPALQAARADCNRGVSGIDGCTSTAIGASTAFSGVTMLMTGDMSAAYDIGALLASECLSPRFKMVVLCNQGGSIFRFIPSTSRLPQRERYFAASQFNLPLAKIADAFSFAYYETHDMAELKDTFSNFVAESERPAILAIYTDGPMSADWLRRYFEVKI